uniref:Uncharacterized protein n=1 Tax=Glossina austeni TaxID=7395 RepID=A0A1A9UUT9_GLOAU
MRKHVSSLHMSDKILSIKCLSGFNKQSQSSNTVMFDVKSTNLLKLKIACNEIVLFVALWCYNLKSFPEKINLTFPSRQLATLISRSRSNVEDVQAIRKSVAESPRISERGTRSRTEHSDKIWSGLVDWLAGWLAGRLVGWLVSWLLGCLHAGSNYKHSNTTVHILSLAYLVVVLVKLLVMINKLYSWPQIDFHVELSDKVNKFNLCLLCENE